MSLFLCPVALAWTFFSARAGEPGDLPSFFKTMSREALNGSPAPAAKDVWAKLGFDSAEARITWKDTGLKWSSTLDKSSVDADQAYDSIEIQSPKNRAPENRENLPVDMISIDLDSGQACIDPKIYMDTHVEYYVVPVSMHDASLFAYESDSEGRHSVILTAGFAYKEVGCAQRLVVRF
ncbi:MAG: hypothetical protein ABW154_07525 [Dyella sp.]